MSREVKFRIWDRETDSWFKPTYRAYEGVLEELLISPSGELHMRTMYGMDHESIFPDRFEKVQYTGLKDKNGMEIYEGDIVKITHEDGDHDVYKIEYKAHEDYPAFDTVPHIDCDSNGLSHAMAVCEIEVIGNIYKHPHLLKEEQE